MNAPAYVLEFEKPLRELSNQIEALQQRSLECRGELKGDIESIEKKIEQTQREIYSNLTPWQRVQIARHPMRPYALDYVDLLCEDFQELHGDRQFSDDRALVGGTAFFNGQAVMVIAQQKGRDTKEKITRCFGLPHPEGYRKALRLMKMAEKFGLPLLSFIDTAGAYPGVGSEERHISEAIAVNLREMAMLKVPSLAVVVGEGSSGGALAIGVTDRVLILEYSYYSVITPEQCAVILWRDNTRAAEAAAAFKLSSNHLLKKLGVVDEVIGEPMGGAHHDVEKTATRLRTSIKKHLADITPLTTDQLLEARYKRYRKLGVFEEPAMAAASG